MKRKGSKRHLELKKQTIADLNRSELSRLNGGGPGQTQSCQKTDCCLTMVVRTCTGELSVCPCVEPITDIC